MTTSTKPQVDFSVVVPVYNSADTLPELIKRLSQVFSSINRSYEIITIDDGSKDSSWNELKKLQKQNHNNLTAIQLMRNFGQHNAIMCGFRAASGRFIITLDDDLQNPPEEIPKLIEKIEREELDLVYGYYKEKKHHLVRNLGSNLTQWFYRAAFNRDNGVSAFRIIRRELIDCANNYNRNYTYLDGLFAWNSTRISEIQVQHDNRRVGESGYSARKLIVLATNLFTNFTLLPLQLVSLLGITMALFGFVAAIYYTYAKIVNDIAVPGFASVMIAIVCFSGIQLLSIGVIGEYLGRLHINSNQKPQYVVRTEHRANSISDDKSSNEKQ